MITVTMITITMITITMITITITITIINENKWGTCGQVTGD